MTQKLKRISTAEAVVNHFRDLLVKGTLEPGDKLPSERNLINEFGISRFSLREGLARLSALGIIEVQHGKGASVRKDVDSSILKDVFMTIINDSGSESFLSMMEARIVLEKEMASMAAAMRTKIEVEKLQKTIQETGEYFDNPLRFAELDYQFHREIAQIAGNQFLCAMQEMLHSVTLAFITKNVENQSVRQKAYEDHLIIFECIKRGYTVRVAREMESHIDTCRRNFQRQFGGIDKREKAERTTTGLRP